MLAKNVINETLFNSSNFVKDSVKTIMNGNGINNTSVVGSASNSATVIDDVKFNLITPPGSPKNLLNPSSSLEGEISLQKIEDWLNSKNRDELEQLLYDQEDLLTTEMKDKLFEALYLDEENFPIPGDSDNLNVEPSGLRRDEILHKMSTHTIEVDIDFS